jgi:hypothetical protein
VFVNACTCGRAKLCSYLLSLNKGGVVGVSPAITITSLCVVIIIMC